MHAIDDNNSATASFCSCDSPLITGPQADGLDSGMKSFFASAAEYRNFMRDPSRVIQLEWRKVRRPHYQQMTSHSWLEASLLDGRRVRIELFADLGLLQTTFSNGSVVARQGMLYRNMVAAAHEFSRALRVAELREVCIAAASSRPYSLFEFNCHHFVLEAWNAVVIEKLQRSHYPDRFKVAILRMLDHRIGNCLRNLDSNRSLGSDGIGLRGDEDGVSQERASVSASVAHQGSCITGEICALARTEADYDRAGRLERFTTALSSGAVHLMELGGDLTPMSLPHVEAASPGSISSSSSSSTSSRSSSACSRASAGSTRPVQAEPEAEPLGILLGIFNSELQWNSMALAELQCEGWANLWLHDKRADALRLAEHMTDTGVAELVARILPGHRPECHNLEKSAMASLGAALFGSRSTAPEGVLPMHQVRRSHMQGSLADVCYVVLAGDVELRVVIYALLRPLSGDRRAWRIRLVSGNACSGEEGRFKYTLQDIPQGSNLSSAISIARSERQSLLSTLLHDQFQMETLAANATAV